MSSKENNTVPTNRFNFTKASIVALPYPEKGTAWYYDEKVSGLMMAVGTKSKTFYLYRKVQGRPERIKIGAWPDLSVDQARGKAMELNTLIAQGQNPANQKRSAKSEITFGEFFLEYMEKHAKPHKKTWSEDEGTYHRYLEGLANRKLSSIVHADLLRIHHSVGDKKGIYAANRMMALVRTMFKLAKDWGYLTGENPASGIKLFREKSRDRYLLAEEIPRFWQALLDEPNIDFVDLFIVCLLTGARRSNVLSMRWEHINLDRAEWRIPETKNGDPLLIPLVDEVVTLLRQRKDKNLTNNSPWVFPGSGSTGHLAEPKKAWIRICKNAGVENLRIHDLRRTLGSSMAAAGVNTITTARTMGQKTLSMALRYQQLSIDPKRAAIEAGAGAILTHAGLRNIVGDTEPETQDSDL